MKCPLCKDVNLVMSEREGIEIDYCPECRGVWLDRGELDKVIERSNKIENYHSNVDDNYYDNDNKKNNYNHNNHKKKESFISNIFDAFGGD
jgi:Zn-finger nucleic acid-binding protein